MLGGGFAVKMGLMPFHLWQVQAYAETPGPGSAFLGAISARMGLYAIIVVLIGMVGIARLVQMEIPYTFLSSRDLLAWIAALTIILPTYTALQQHDARYLLAWHGIGQGGYMLLGLVIGSATGSAGGLLHVFNYAITQAALLMAVFAVVHRTGTADLNKMGGLVTRMPHGQFTLAFTLGHTILGQSDASLDIARDHEMVHVRQFEQWGPFMGPVYLLSSLVLWIAGRRPYRDNPFEREAYEQGGGE